MELDEEKLIEVAKPYFEHCRSGDWEHAKRAVEWVRKLGKGREDLDLLIMAVYIHDIGWSGIAPKGKLSFEKIISLEDRANENTPKMVRKVLEKLEYSKEEIQEVIRLVKAADSYESQREDEEIIVDADQLSNMCIEHLQEKFKPSSFQEAVDHREKIFITKVKTEMAKKIYPKLLEKLKQDVKKYL